MENNLCRALALDLSVLKSLLERHRCSHGRTLYVRRMQMVLRAIQRHNLLQVTSQVQDFQTQIQNYQTRKKTSTEEHWQVTGTGRIAHEGDADRRALRETYDALQETFAKVCPEILSRIEHASKPLFVELNRGFFLPFVTVALAALARIRSVLMEIGKWGLSQLVSIEWHDGSWVETAMLPFLPVPDLSKKERQVQIRKEREQMLGRLGLIQPTSTDTTSRPTTTKDDSQKKEEESDGKVVGKTNKDDANDESTNRASLDDMELEPQANEGPDSEDDDDDDIGESLVETTKEPQKVSAVAKTPSEKKRKRDPVDQNSAVLATLKGKKDKASDKKGSDAKESKKKKKKKKKAKGDFFDALFS